MAGHHSNTDCAVSLLLVDIRNIQTAKSQVEVQGQALSGFEGAPIQLQGQPAFTDWTSTPQGAPQPLPTRS